MNGMRRTGQALSRLVFAGVVLASLALPGCREEEQDRILLFEKGTYLGPADQALNQAQADDLRRRTLGQKF